jgi:hypothetical protein
MQVLFLHDLPLFSGLYALIDTWRSRSALAVGDKLGIDVADCFSA